MSRVYLPPERPVKGNLVAAEDIFQPGQKVQT
jgi:hypothetical protein